jgi:magnesium chelatase accessory protein
MPALHDGRSSTPEWPQTEHSRFVERGGIRWHVQVMGSGPTMLLVHGTGASSHSFRDLMPLLAERYTVVVPDLPGHAISTAPPLFEPSLPATAAALDELLEALQMTPTVAVGHSAGAALIARMTLDRAIAPQLLVGLGAALVPFRGVARAIFPPTARFLAHTSLAARLIALRARDGNNVARVLAGTGSALDERGVELYRRLTARPGHIAAVLAMMASWDLEPLYAELPDLDTRFLLVAGERDRAVPLSQQREIADRAPGARIVVVPGTGHLVHEEAPARVARLILDEGDAMRPAK